MDRPDPAEPDRDRRPRWRHRSSLGHNYLGCERLLLGLLDDPSSGAGQVLHSVGIDKAGIRRAITSAAAGFAQAAQDTTGSRHRQELDELIQRLEAIEHRLTAAHL